MAKKNTLLLWGLGCGGVGVLGLLACGGLVAMLIPAIRDFGETITQAIEAEQQHDAFADNWRPPPDEADPQTLFPEKVGEYRRTGHDANAAVAAFGIDVAGHHATYKSGPHEIEVYVYRATRLEKEALYQRVSDAIENGDYNWRTSFGGPQADRYTFTVSPPSQMGSLWWSQDWLFFFHVMGEEDPQPFLDVYLRDIQRPEGNGAKTGDKAAPAADQG